MNKALLKNILIVLLLTIAVFCVFKYIASLKEKYDLLNTLNQIKEQVATLEKKEQGLLETLEKEKELQRKLSQENSGLKDGLKISKIRLMKLFREAKETQKSIEQLNAQFSILKAENKALIEKEDKLKAQFSQVSQENETLKARLGSVVELKKAIRELKRQMRKVSIEINQETQDEKIVEGNHGFLIKDGKLTYPTRVRIKVIPTPPALKKE